MYVALFFRSGEDPTRFEIEALPITGLQKLTKRYTLAKFNGVLL